MKGVKFLGVIVLCAAIITVVALAATRYEDSTLVNPCEKLNTYSKLGSDPTEFIYNKEKQIVEPFAYFDDLYYVGIAWVGAYLLDTGDGLILIDTLHDPYVQVGQENIEKLGFSPKDIKYVIVTHGHFAHVGGAACYHNKYGAKVIMTDAALNKAKLDRNQKDFPISVPTVSRYVSDGDVLTLGDKTIKFYETPGHSKGTLSLEFTVKDRGKEYTAFMFGGVGAYSRRSEDFDDFIASVTRVIGIVKDDNVTVGVIGHPMTVNDLIKVGPSLSKRPKGQPHPFIGQKAYLDWLTKLKSDTEMKKKELLEDEKTGETATL